MPTPPPQHPRLPDPVFDEDGITLYRGDAREILPLLERDAVDLVATDPPYGISYQSSAATPSRPIAGDGDLNVMRDVVVLADRLLHPDRHAYLFAAPLKLGEATDAIAELWRVKNIIVWDKGDAGTRGDLTGDYARNWEAIVYAMKGRRTLVGPRPRATIRYDWSARREPGLSLACSPPTRAPR